MTTTVGGFWYGEYGPDGTPARGEPGWRARFTPTVAGEWAARVTMQPSGLASQELRFLTAERAAAGFVRVDPAYPRHFAFDDGTRFLPVGVNMSWWNEDPLQDYIRWLDHFAAQGGNTIRVWMANWSFGLEWNDTELGDYRPRLRQAWLLDRLFELAAERGVQVILVLNHHGQFSRSVNPQWHENPYNEALGGPLATPEQFASDPEAIALFQRRLRYIVDRWAAAPNLLAWEWWNEYNYTPISDTQMAQWLDRMEPFLRNRDPYDHLITISGPSGPNSIIWQRPAIDFVSVHIYTTQDLLGVAAQMTENYTPVVGEKPLLLAEFGFATGSEGTDSWDQEGIHLHNGLWATLFSGHAGTGMYWWWDTYIEPLGLWRHFGALSHFLENVDPAILVSSEAVLLAGDGGVPNAQGLLLKGTEQQLLWVRNNAYTAEALTAAHEAALRDALRAKQKLDSFIYTPAPVLGHRVELAGRDERQHEVQWYDPQAGEWGSVERVTAVDGVLSIPLPSFSRDIAAKIRPLVE
jgi:hypothetical protein